MFSEGDLSLFAEKGISAAVVEQQINNFKNGFPYLQLVKAASVNDGIINLSPTDLEACIQYYEEHLLGNRILKFVPASGAASRMFKEFFELMHDPQSASDNPQAIEALEQLKEFAFYDELKNAMASNGEDLADCLVHKNYQKVLSYILTEQGLNYGFLPKGLLLFHTYLAGARAPVEEHLVEAAHYGKGADGSSYLHFTVSPQHRDYFDALERRAKDEYQQQYSVQYHISYSEQKPATDTVAVNLENEPFRNEDGTILFRPGGHGALLENLNDVSGDVIFIKNVDNVVPDHLKAETYRYKKALAGLLLQTRTKIFHFLDALDNTPNFSLYDEIAQFLLEDLNVIPPSGQKVNEQYLRMKLNRPLRICGMVKNSGEPGGGPFWVKGTDDSISLQIGETSQINMSQASQRDIVQNATHFNPVDLVCSTIDYQGNKFDLLQFRDPETGFISQKSKGGKELKALELPGLWNGAMADWNTLFVEVPAITFNPVKTVNDLLRNEHQST